MAKPINLPETGLQIRNYCRARGVRFSQMHSDRPSKYSDSTWFTGLASAKVRARVVADLTKLGFKRVLPGHGVISFEAENGVSVSFTRVKTGTWRVRAEGWKRAVANPLSIHY